MVHDRRIDGKAHVFGNQGALFMRAMTWWDHETHSIWSQPWGMAIDGVLNGTRLDLIPASVTPWENWLTDHPDTLVLDIGVGRSFRFREGFHPNFVIGVTLGDHAKAYHFVPASEAGMINDRLGAVPVLVLADRETKAVQVYQRIAGEQELEFSLLDGWLVDRQTGSVWDVATGIAAEGPLKGEALRQLPYITAFEFAWLDFYPHSKLYQPNDERRPQPALSDHPSE